MQDVGFGVLGAKTGNLNSVLARLFGVLAVSGRSLKVVDWLGASPLQDG